MQKPGRTSIPGDPIIGQAIYGQVIYGQAIYAFSQGGGTAYTDAQVLALLASGGLESWAFDRLDSYGNYVSDLTPYVVKGSVPTVTHDSTAAVKRTLTIRLIGSAPLVPLSDQIGVRYLRAAPDGGWLEFYLGKFPANPPKRTVTPAASWLDFTATDYSQLLLDAPFQVSTSVAAGSGYIADVRTITTGYGGGMALNSQIIDPGTTLPSALIWTVDYSRLAAINDLLGAINYGTVWFDENGIERADPIPDYNAVSASYVFDATQGQAQILPWQETPDMSRAANTLIVVGQDPQRAAVSATYVNSDPTSPVSTVSWNRIKTKVIRDSTIPDTATAAARAKIEAQAASRVYSELVVPSLPWPLSQEKDVYGLIYSTTDEGTVNGLYLELGWTHRCATGQPTDHRLTRISSH